jgi:hypothetical protein
MQRMETMDTDTNSLRVPDADLRTYNLTNGETSEGLKSLTRNRIVRRSCRTNELVSKPRRAEMKKWSTLKIRVVAGVSLVAVVIYTIVLISMNT